MVASIENRQDKHAPSDSALIERHGDCFCGAAQLYYCASGVCFVVVNFFVSVPCKLLAKLIEKLEAHSTVVYTPVAREEEAVGMACGAYWRAGAVPS